MMFGIIKRSLFNLNRIMWAINVVWKRFYLNCGPCCFFDMTLFDDHLCQNFSLLSYIIKNLTALLMVIKIQMNLRFYINKRTDLWNQFSYSFEIFWLYCILLGTEYTELDVLFIVFVTLNDSIKIDLIILPHTKKNKFYKCLHRMIYSVYHKR